MIVFLLRTEENLYQYNWICHKCAKINEIYQWNSNLCEEDDEIEVNCCKTKDILFKHTINFDNKKLLWKNNTDKYKNNAFENSNKMKIIKDYAKSSQLEAEYVYDFEILKVSNYDNDEEIMSEIVVSDELTDEHYEYSGIKKDNDNIYYNDEEYLKHCHWKVNYCLKSKLENDFLNFSAYYGDEYCCCWRLETSNIDAQKQIMEYAKNGDIVVYPDWCCLES